MGDTRKRVNILAGSHIPVLEKLLRATKGSVLELGMGFNSTPLLYWICKAEDRRLVSMETDKEWIDKLQYPGIHVKDWDKISFETQDHWSIALVDSKPARKRRSLVKRLKNCADFVVLHDSELADNPAYKYTPVYKEFKYKYEYTRVMPRTMVLSNFKNPAPYILTV